MPCASQLIAVRRQLPKAGSQLAGLADCRNAPSIMVRRPQISAELAFLALPLHEAATQRDLGIYRVVVDAMTLIEDVLHRLPPGAAPEARDEANWPKASALSDAASAGTIRLFGKVDLLQEVVEHLPDVAARKGHDLQAASALLERDYVPYLRLVDVAGISLPEAEAVLTRIGLPYPQGDPDDEPTARLAFLLDPCIVLTNDRLLTRNGIGTKFDPDSPFVGWLSAAVAVRNRGFTTQLRAGAGAAAITGSIPALAIYQSTMAARRHPRTAMALIGAMGVAAWMSRSSPRWHGIRTAAAASISAAVSEFSAATADKIGPATDAHRRLVEHAASHPPSTVPEASLARVLAVFPADPGLTVGELRVIAGRDIDVAAALAHPAFVRVSRYRWTLGWAASLR